MLRPRADDAQNSGVKLPASRRSARLLIVSWGIVTFIWLGLEDDGALAVSLLGAATALMWGILWTLNRIGGGFITWRQLTTLSLLLGLAIGLGAGVVTAGLMLLKNAYHAHVVPDYPAGMIGAALARVPAWAGSGALIGLGIRFLWQYDALSTDIPTRENTHTMQGEDTTRIYLIRHGETDWNLDGRFQGQSDTELNATGHQQAANLAAYFQAIGETADALYTSPLKRAKATAQPLADVFNLEPQPAAALREIYCGEWEGLNHDEIEASYPGELAQWHADVEGFRMPQGESVWDVQQRVAPFFDDVIQRHTGQTVVIVAHGASLLALLAYINGWNLTEAWNDKERRLANAAITLLERSADGDYTIVQYNEAMV